MNRATGGFSIKRVYGPPEPQDKGHVTFLFAAHDEAQSHAVTLRDFLGG